MATTLSTVAFSNLGKHRLRFALTSIGIAISAFFLTAVLLVNTSFYDAIGASATQRYSTADAVVETTEKVTQGSTPNSLLSQAQVEKVTSLPGVESAWAVASTYTVIHTPAESEGQGSTFSAVQADLPEASFFPYSLIEGSLPSSSYQVVMNSRVAKALSVEVGGSIVLDDFSSVTEHTNLDEPLPQARYTVTGIYESPESYQAGTDTIFTSGKGVATFIEHSRVHWANADDGIYEQVLLKLKDPSSASFDEIQRALANSPALTVSSVEDQVRNDISHTVGGFPDLLAVLFAFGALSLLMSSFIIASTFKVYATARAREIALLRTLGATRLAVVRMLLLEAAALGALSSLAGVVTAYLAALALDSTGRVTYNPAAGALALLACTLVTLLAVLKPVWATRAIPPVADLQSNQELEGVSASQRKGAFTALCMTLTVVSAACIYAGIQRQNAPLLVLATVLSALTFVLAAPLLIAPGLTLLRRFTRPHTTADLAHSNLAQAPASASVTIRMIFISAALTGYSTLQASVLAELESNYPYDVEAVVTESDAVRLHEIQRQVSQLEGVDAALIALPKGEVQVPTDSYFTNQAYSVDQQALARLHGEQTAQKLTERTVLLSQAYADAFGMQEGQQLSIEGSRETVQLTAAITPDVLRGFLITTNNGHLISGTDLLEPSGQQLLGGLLQANLEPDLSWGDRFSMLAPITEITGLDAGELSGITLEKARLQDDMRTVLWAVMGLLSVSLLVSLVGLANTQLLSAQHRRRSYALLRINGLSSRRLQAAISYETLILALFALIWGVVAGVLTALILLHSFTVQDFDVVYALEPWRYAAVIAGGLALTWASVFFPARSASRTPPIAALQQVS